MIVHVLLIPAYVIAICFDRGYTIFKSPIINKTNNNYVQSRLTAVKNNCYMFSLLF